TGPAAAPRAPISVRRTARRCSCVTLEARLTVCMALVAGAGSWVGEVLRAAHGPRYDLPRSRAVPGTLFGLFRRRAGCYISLLCADPGAGPARAPVPLVCSRHMTAGPGS